jgi:hypothetical protein
MNPKKTKNLKKRKKDDKNYILRRAFCSRNSQHTCTSRTTTDL